ncbi:hypothetical protein ACVWXU_001007 [Streptomyces sp. TE33382]
MLGSASTVLPSGHGGCPATHDAINLRGLKAPQWAARRIVRKTLAGKAGIECTDDVVLVADELVGNAIEHAGAAVNLSLDVYDWGVVVQVGDSGEDLAAVPGKPLVAQEDDEGGRGPVSSGRTCERLGSPARQEGEARHRDLPLPSGRR